VSLGKSAARADTRADDTAADLRATAHPKFTARGGRSPWNAAIELFLNCDLTTEEHRLALVLMRNTLGFRRRESRVGRDLLRREAQLHGRSLDRALACLVKKGVLHFESGRPGPGGRGLYRLLIDWDEPAAQDRQFMCRETAADERRFGHHEGAAPERQFARETAAKFAGETAAFERQRNGEKGYNDDAELDCVLKPLGLLAPSQRTEALVAWRESMDGVRHVVAEAMKGARPAGLFTEMIRAGDHRSVRVSGPPRRPCAECGTGAGLHTVDCPGPSKSGMVQALTP
jgi:hypothetical protein